MVYFIKQKDLVKIGFTNNPSLRVKEIIQSASDKAELLGIIEGSRQYEMLLQSKFKHLHNHREWFKYTEEIQNFLDTKNLHSIVEIKKRIKFFGKLKNLRLEAGYTLQGLADKLNIKPPSVDEMERGFEKGSIQINTLNKYLDEIGYEIKIVKKGS